MSRPERFLRACRRQSVDATPIWIMRQAGRYLPGYRAVRAKVPFLELCKTPDLATEVTVQPVRALGVDAAILFSDILLLCEAMGAQLLLEDQGPQFPEPVRSARDVDRLRVPDPEAELPFVTEAVRRIRKELRGEVPLIGFAGAPWTLAAYLIEGKTSRSFENAKALLLGDEALAARLLGKIADAVTLYLDAQLAAGAQALQIFDSWAGALSAADYARLGAPYLERIIRGLHRDPIAPQPVIVFGVETGELLPQLARTGAEVVGVDWRVPLSEARRRVGASAALQGNLDPASLLLPPAQLEARALDILDEARAAGPGHVFNLGHGILPSTPWQNARHLVELVHARTRSG